MTIWCVLPAVTMETHQAYVSKALLYPCYLLLTQEGWILYKMAEGTEVEYNISRI